MILHDLECDVCGEIIEDFNVSGLPPRLLHFRCGGEVSIAWRARSARNAQWSDRDASVYFRNPVTGELSIPMRNTARPPEGFERHEMRSLAEVQRFERASGRTSEMLHFDHAYDGFPTGHPDYPVT